MTRRRPHLMSPAIGVVLVVAALASAAMFAGTVRDAHRTTAARPAPEPGRTYEVRGVVRLPTGQYTRDGSGCRGTTIGDEPQVVVGDGTGRALSYAPLGAGRPAGGACEMPFTAHVPAGKGTYRLDVPWWGAAVYTEQELADPDTLERTYG